MFVVFLDLLRGIASLITLHGDSTRRRLLAVPSGKFFRFFGDSLRIRPSSFNICHAGVLVSFCPPGGYQFQVLMKNYMTGVICDAVI